jgi:hypothetical protein
VGWKCPAKSLSTEWSRLTSSISGAPFLVIQTLDPKGTQSADRIFNLGAGNRVALVRSYDSCHSLQAHFLGIHCTQQTLHYLSAIRSTPPSSYIMCLICLVHVTQAGHFSFPHLAHALVFMLLRHPHWKQISSYRVRLL